MEYSFDIEMAEKYGVNEAIVIKNLSFWIMKNKASKKHSYEGRTWTYNSVSAFSILFPFWTDNQMRRILESLVEQSVIIKGNFNKVAYDQTTWYAFVDEDIFLPSCDGGNVTYKGHVYIIKDKNGVHKIGRSKNVSRRMKDYKDIEIVAMYETSDINGDERKLHNMFINKRIAGEWFNLDANDLKSISIFNFCQMEEAESENRTGKINKPIPDINTDIKTDTIKKTASTQAAAPQRVKSTVTLIRELFVSNGSTYYHDGKEARACKLLMTRYESDVEGFTERLLAFKEMIRTDTFFSKQPFSPSALNSLWNRIIVKSPTPSSAAPLPVESWEDYIYRIRRELADAGYEVGDITLDSELDALYSKHQKKIRNGRV